MKPKKVFPSILLCFVLVAIVSCAAPADEPIETSQAVGMACESLIDLQLPDATITAAEIINEPVEKPGVIVHGIWKSPQSAFGQASVSANFCRVAALVSPAINYEVWLPLPEDWNGKFNGVGNGALSGGINYNAMADPLTKGYATASTDSGHQSPAPVLGDWMAGHPELWVDFGYRAIHVMTRGAKSIIEAYYGQAPEHSYFTGCSGGGQQGLAEAQRYPADYDGVVSGEPANYPTRMWPGEIWPSYVTHRTSQNLIPEAKLPIIHNGALAACDASDGVTDGVISDPINCSFDTSGLLCQGENTAECLTAGEVDSVKLVYSGLKDPTTGEQYWPGYEPGSELGWAGHIGEPFIIPQGYFINVLFQNPNWDWTTFDFTSPTDFDILLKGDATYGPIFNATDPDLTAFNLLGGKLIMWHGWADQNIAPRNSINYYNNVIADVGSEEATQEFLRLFMVPGLGHCLQGPGPTGNVALAALEQWVEESVAPTSVIGDQARLLCPFPQETQYSGSGSTEDVANFSCANP